MRAVLTGSGVSALGAKVQPFFKTNKFLEKFFVGMVKYDSDGKSRTKLYEP